MGFFSKIGKGIKKVFKKIGGAIKKGFKKFGKFMGKAGILGQIAMMFIIPGIGGALMKGIGGAFKGLVGATAEGVKAAAVTSQSAAAAGSAASTAVGTGTATAAQTATIKAGELATKSLTKLMDKGILKGSIKGALEATRGTGLLGSSSGLANGIGSVLQAAGNFVKVGAKAFSTVTEGISSFIGEFSKTALNKIPGINIGSAAPTMGQAWKNVQNSVMKNASGTVQAFNTSIGIEPTAGSTKFGTEGFKVADRVSVDSLQKASLQKELAGSSVKLLEADGGSLTLPANTNLSNLKAGDIADIKSRALGLGDDGLQMPTYDSTGALTDPAVGAQPYNAQNNIMSREIAAMKKQAAAQNSLLNKQPIFTKPVVSKIGTDVVTPGSDPSVANLNFGEQIVQNVLEVPGKIKESILDFPNKIATVPEKIGDDLTNTVATAPSTLFNAAVNKPDAAQVTNSSVALSSIPQSTYGMNQSNIAESGIAVAGYQSKVNPTALYGSENQAYNQFLKMLGPQPQQMRS